MEGRLSLILQGAWKCKLCLSLPCLWARELGFAISKPVSHCLWDHLGEHKCPRFPAFYISKATSGAQGQKSHRCQSLEANCTEVGGRCRETPKGLNWRSGCNNANFSYTTSGILTYLAFTWNLFSTRYLHGWAPVLQIFACHLLNEVYLLHSFKFAIPLLIFQSLLTRFICIL